MSLCGQGKYEKGIRVWGGSVKKQEEMNMSMAVLKFWIILQEQTINKDKERLGEPEANKLLNEGRIFTYDQLVEYALDSDRE